MPSSHSSIPALTIPSPHTATSQPARIVNLYVADSSGISNAVIANLLEAALMDYRAAGIGVVLSTSVPQIVSVTLSLAFAAGINTVELTQNIRAAVFEYVNSLPVNGILERAALFGILLRFKSQGLIVRDTSVVAPAGDLVPAPGATLRTLLDQIVVV